MLAVVRPEDVERTPLSPELVLVTPEIADYARGCLPEEPWAAFVHPPRTVAAATSKLPADRPTADRPTRRGLGRVALGGVALVGGLAIAYLPSDWGQLDVAAAHGTRAAVLSGRARPDVTAVLETRTGLLSAAATAAQPQPPTMHEHATIQAGVEGALRVAGSRARPSPLGVSAHAVLAHAVSAHAPAAGRGKQHGEQAKPRRPRAISWPAVAGAAYYDVRLLRDGVRILDLWPRTAHAVLPLRWTYGGARYQLGPGTYRWYVFAGSGDPLELRLGALHRQGELSVSGAAPSR